MNGFKKYLIPVVLVCLLLASLVGCSSAPASLGEIFDPSGNPFANRFSDVKDIRTATYVVAASDSEHKYEADYFCSGTNDHVQVQAAIDALPATGGEVFLLDGTYNIEVSLVLDSSQTLRGCGHNTILTTTTDDVDIITATGGSGTEKVGILIADLFLDGWTPGGTADTAIFFTYVDLSIISNVWCEWSDEDTITLVTSDQNIIEGCMVMGGQSGIDLYDCDYVTVTGNYVYTNPIAGIDGEDCNYLNIVANTGWDNAYSVRMTTCSRLDITGNNFTGDTEESMFLEAVTHSAITGNTCEAAYDGIFVKTSHHNTFSGNSLTNSFSCGFYAQGSDYNVITGNTIQLNYESGIYLYQSNHNLITGNILLENSNSATNTFDNILIEEQSDFNTVQGNFLRAGEETEKPRYGINIIEANCNDNRVLDNDLYNDGYGTAPFNDAGTDTMINSITVPFSDGSDIQDSGYLIDLAGEFANAWAFLNKEVVQVVRIKVYARAVPAEADKMRAEFVIYGATDNQVYTIIDGSVADHPSTSSNFAADDVIYWTITEAGVLALLGGDSVEIKVLHEAVGDGDIDTQAYFRTVTIEYV